MTYRLHITDRAIGDLRAIRDYIARDSAEIENEFKCPIRNLT